ncbi:MAG: methylated-DNA--[protein]-cysteine S-methyltransferase [Actinocrinis sp.]
MTVYTRIGSPVGELLMVGEKSDGAPGGLALSSLSMSGQRTAPTITNGWIEDGAAFAQVTRQLAQYFAGERRDFGLAFTDAGSTFQRDVWQAVELIGYGETTTYGALAKRLGVARDRIQAVGAAVGANPLLIVRPCHRVVGADGSMRGYAGGVERKVQLLAHEGAIAPMLA